MRTRTTTTVFDEITYTRVELNKGRQHGDCDHCKKCLLKLAVLGDTTQDENEELASLLVGANPYLSVYNNYGRQFKDITIYSTDTVKDHIKAWAKLNAAENPAAYEHALWLFNADRGHHISQDELTEQEGDILMAAEHQILAYNKSGMKDLTDPLISYLPSNLPHVNI